MGCASAFEWFVVLLLLSENGWKKIRRLGVGGAGGRVKAGVEWLLRVVFLLRLLLLVLQREVEQLLGGINI